jgi:hypothetical protein
MKKIFTTICLASLSTFGFSQSFRLFVGATDVTGTVIEIPVHDTSITIYDIDIHNISSSAVSYKVNRVISNAPLDPNCILYFCTGTNCYPPNWNGSYTGAVTATIPANSNQINAAGIGTHFEESNPATELYVHYRIFNTADATDSAGVTLHYALTTTGINESVKTGGTISNAYPNPGGSLISVKYNMNENSEKGKIVVYDMLGKIVKEVVLADKQGVSKIDVSELTAGIYFYTFMIDGKAINTKKLVVSAK